MQYLQPQVFYICNPYLFLHIYDPFGILCLAVLFGFANAYEVFSGIHKYFTFGSHICS